jgi:hypothetical protein
MQELERGPCVLGGFCCQPSLSGRPRRCVFTPFWTCPLQASSVFCRGRQGEYLENQFICFPGISLFPIRSYPQAFKFGVSSFWSTMAFHQRSALARFLLGLLASVLLSVFRPGLALFPVYPPLVLGARTLSLSCSTTGYLGTPELTKIAYLALLQADRKRVVFVVFTVPATC